MMKFSYLTITALSFSDGSSLLLYTPLLMTGFEDAECGWVFLDPDKIDEVNDRLPILKLLSNDSFPN